MTNEIKNEIAEFYNRRRLEMELFGELSKANVSLYNADCREILKTLKQNSIDACVTDPPYHLTSTKNSSKGIMNKEWDGGDIAFSVELWAEVLNVLKYGGWLLAFGHPRTYHKMASAIEQAGFEIIDSISWLYGNGMLTAHNMGNAFDKKANAIRKVIGQINRGNGRQFAECCNGFKKGVVDITEPETDAAKQWDGWRNKLKPSHEVIVVARKPIEGSLTDNVQKYGCGALNLKACKLENGNLPTNTIISEEVADTLKDKAPFFYCPKPSKEERHAGCEHIVGSCRSDSSKQRTYRDKCAVCGKKFLGTEHTKCQCPIGVKKTDTSLVETGNYHITVKPIRLMQYLVELVTPPNGICLDIFAGSGTTGLACINLGIDCILIEKDKDYFEIVKARVAFAQGRNPSDAA
jgi:site-specific DNA-methyltransferase (adenine-specific)